MARYKIEHDQPGCIGCNACAALHPENWEMTDVAGDVKAKCLKTDIEEGTDFERNKEAADTCPVNVIHIIDNKEKKKLV